MTILRQIPSIDALRQRDAVRALEAAFGPDQVVDALRAAAAALRDDLSGGRAVADPGAAIVDAARAGLEELVRPSLRPVINATGVVLHTNLGRAPLSAEAIRSVASVAGGYSNLEYDLERGGRSSRSHHAEALLRRLTGAAAALVVNNTAAATLLALSALARGREVLIARGELVAIGGGFRIPDVLQQSGARLREIGTTNRTRAADYAAAIGERTAAILRVHPSNFRVTGFVERPSLPELVDLGRRHAVPVLEDLGSGYTGLPASPALAGEPVVRKSVEDGVTLAMFSGDKLLGGPQAGMIVGQAAAIEQLARHPLMRAVRVDKMTLAALEATLAAHVAGRAATAVPALAMIAMTAETLRTRARAVADAVSNGGVLTAAVIDGASAIGGGSAPGETLPTSLVSLRHPLRSADALAAALRAQDPPIVARVEADCVVLDLRTVAPDQDARLVDLIACADPV